MTVMICPRCGEPLPSDAYWEELAPCADRLPASRLRHKRADGKTCVLYAGPPAVEPNTAKG